MATVIGAIAGAFFPGTPLQFALVALGSYIDQQYILPKAFPQDPIEGPRLADLSLQTASEGDPLKWVQGAFNRVAGTVIWPEKDIINEVPSTSGGGKKGGGGKSGPETTLYSYNASFAIVLADSTFAGMKFRMRKVWANTQVIYDEEGDTEYYKSLTFYDGTQETPDPVMEAREGAGNVPIYKDMVYVVFEELNLDDWRSLPNITVWLEQDDDISLAEVYANLLQRAGLTEDEYDVSSLDQCFRGMIVSGPQSTFDIIRQLMSTYGNSVAEEKGKLVFRKRGRERVHKISSSILSVREADSEPSERKLRLRDRPGVQVPKEVNARFTDWQRDMVRGSARWRRPSFGEGSHVEVFQAPVALSKSEGIAVAKSIGLSSESERTEVEFSLPPSMMHIHEGDALNVDDGDFYIFVLHIDRGHNYMLTGRGILMQPHTYDQVGLEITDPTVPGAYRPPETEGHIVDIPAVLDDHHSKFGVYWVVSASDPEAEWRGARLYEKHLSAFAEVGATAVEATQGLLLTELDPGPTTITDHGTEITVKMVHGTLSSLNDEDFLQGGNLAAVRKSDGTWEILSFRDAELLGDNVYTLRTLMRGIRGTNIHVDKTCDPGSPLVLLNIDGSVRFHQPAAAFSGTRLYKFPAFRGLIADYPESEVGVQGNTVRCMPPANLEYSFAADGALTVKWVPRTRRIGGWLSGLGLVADEKPETYDINFYAGGPRSLDLRRTVQVSEEQEYTYSATDQTTDGLTPGTTPVTAEIFQVSTDTGRGNPARIWCDP